MNWDAVSGVGEIIGAVAVIVSLIYVGIQIKENSRAVRSATANETTNAISTWYASVGSDPRSSHIFYTGMRDPDLFSPEEWLQFVFLTHGLMLKYQTAFYLTREGTLDIDISQTITSTLSGTRETPGFLRYWEERGTVFDPEFRAYVEDILSSGTTNTGLGAVYRSTAE
jgi:hypothetical protein